MTINKTRRLSWVMCPPTKQLALILAFLLGALLVEKAAGIVPSQAEDFLDRQNVYSIAVLPPVGDSVPDSVRKAAGDLFILKLTLRRSSVRVVRPEALVEQLNKAGKLSEFASFVNLLSQTGVVNRESLTAIGNTADPSTRIKRKESLDAGGSLYASGGVTQNANRPLVCLQDSPLKAERNSGASF